VAPLVLDQGAVRTVQPPREASERDAAPLPSAAKSDAQTDLRARVGRLQPLPMDHVAILPYNGQARIASVVGLFSDHVTDQCKIRGERFRRITCDQEQGGVEGPYGGWGAEDIGGHP